MATVKDLAAYVCDKLAGKVLIHRYDAYSTNSVYLKFDYGLGNSLRLSDHTGKAGLNYRFNIITTMKSLGIDTSGEYPRFYYPPDMVDQAIADIVKGVTEKRGRYHDYYPCNAGGLCVDDCNEEGVTCGSRIYNPEHPDAPCSARSKKPEGVAVELADAVIRIADLCGHLGIDLDAVIEEKMAYNADRPYKHGKRF